VLKKIKLAEGGGGFEFDFNELQHLLPDDNDDDDEQEADRTQPFQNGQASNSYHGGEQVEIETVQHENSGLFSANTAE